MRGRMNLNLADLEMVNGGACEATCHDELIFNTEYDGHTYEMWRCVECGEETYIIDGLEVQPSTYYKAYYGVGR